MNHEGVNPPCLAFSLEDGVKRAAGDRRTTGVRETRLEHKTRDLRTGGVREGTGDGVRGPRSGGTPPPPGGGGGGPRPGGTPPPLCWRNPHRQREGLHSGETPAGGAPAGHVV